MMNSDKIYLWIKDKKSFLDYRQLKSITMKCNSLNKNMTAWKQLWIPKYNAIVKFFIVGTRGYCTYS